MFPNLWSVFPIRWNPSQVLSLALPFVHEQRKRTLHTGHSPANISSAYG